MEKISSLYIAGMVAVAFIGGLLIGFWGRPVLIQDIPIEVKVTVVSESVEPQAESESKSPTPDSAAEQRPTPTIMDLVLTDARHSQGDPSAPVTIVEFSDFN